MPEKIYFKRTFLEITLENTRKFLQLRTFRTILQVKLLVHGANFDLKPIYRFRLT